MIIPSADDVLTLVLLVNKRKIAGQMTGIRGIDILIDFERILLAVKHNVAVHALRNLTIAPALQFPCAGNLVQRDLRISVILIGVILFA